MTRFHLTNPSFIFLTIFVVLIFVVPYSIVAQESLSSLSGRVVNSKGEPIAGVTLSLASSRAKTDSEGRFVLNKIPSRQVQLILLQYNKYDPSYRIRAIKFGKVSIYYHDPDPRDAVVISIKPGTNINDVEVIMEYQLKIHCRIVFKNGEPLANTYLRIKVDVLPLNATRSYSFNLPFTTTDAQGNFVYSVYSPGVYALSVNYRELSAELDPFLFEEGKQPETQVLTLNGNFEDLSEPKPDELKQKEVYRPRNVPEVSGMWIINPANGHAYKRILCDDRFKAQTQAKKEDAHLVTITSEAEQIWLEAVFGSGPYWIGLTDIAEEGKWRWDTGEPVTYTNWGVYEDDPIKLRDDTPAFLKFFGFKDESLRHEEEMQDYAIMSSRKWENEIGKWRTADSRVAHRVGRIWMAIIEKEGN
ncbi:hypothetical protein J4G08_12380 [Candidatus Poribacteria bacterium]|nr:hypothetical protein [Candidatus Poribacteria bacterium]